MAKRKLGKNPEQIAKLEELHTKLSKRKSYYKTKYGDETLGTVPTQKIANIGYLTDYREYVRTLEKALKQEITPVNKRNKKGVLLPISEVNELKAEYKRINKIKKERRKEIDKHGVTYGGKKLTIDEAIKRGDKRFEDLILLEFDINKFTSANALLNKKRDINEIYEGDFLHRWDEDYRGSYLKALQDQIGVYPEVGSEYTRLKEHIENMSREDFMKFYYTKEFANITFLYDRSAAELKINKLLHEWEVPEPEVAA